MITVSIESKTNGDSEHQKEANNTKDEIHLCPDCNKIYWKEISDIIYDIEKTKKVIKLLNGAKKAADKLKV
jgi:uncharacterized protein with PIN domain